MLTFTRLAADRLGKQLDPSGDFADPAAPVVVGALGRAADPVTRSYGFSNGTYAERSGNRNGHVIEWEEVKGWTGDRFSWRIFLVAGDPERPETYFAGSDKSEVGAISCPDNLEFDPAGNLWISTDGNVLSRGNQTEGTVGGTNDGLGTGAPRGVPHRAARGRVQRSAHSAGLEVGLRLGPAPGGDHGLDAGRTDEHLAQPPADAASVLTSAVTATAISGRAAGRCGGRAPGRVR